MTGNRPMVSIGIPVYNGAEYLREALDSILAQTYDNLEIIISDNASEDNTESISREYAARDPRIRYVRGETNRGAAWNYNNTVRLARGKYFKWAAHDDWLAPDYVEQCVDELESSETVALAYPRTTLVCEDPDERQFYGGRFVRYEDRLDTRDPDPIARLCHVAKHLDLCNPVMGIFPRATLMRTGRIRPFSGSDVLLLSEISLLGEIHEIPDWLFYRRRHARSSRLENRSAESVAKWFGGDRGSFSKLLSTRSRLLLEHIRLIRQAPFSTAQRVRGVFSFLAARAVRRARVLGGRYKRRLLGQSLAVRSQPKAPSNRP